VTLIFTLKVAEGLVLAAESRMTISEGNVPVYYSEVQKLFPLKDYPAAILTCGSGFLQSKALSSWIRAFDSELPHNLSLRHVAERLQKFLAPSDPGTTTTLVLAGFNREAVQGFEAEMYKITAFEDGEQNFFDLSESVSFWDGDFEAVTRLLLGRSPTYFEGIASHVDKGYLKTLDKSVQMNPPYYAMSLQEGIDFVDFLMQTQIQFQRFASQPQSCGGPVDIAVITPEEGFQWVRRKTLRLS
jgi:hypothetical protein